MTDDRVAVVTGASSGIGRGVAERLAADGLDVVVADVRREPKQGEHYDTDVTRPTDDLLVDEHGVASTFVETDVSDPDDVKILVDRTVEEFGRLDVLVNNAGIGIPGDSQAITVEEWKRVVGVNLTGQFLAAKYAVPHLVESPRGRIVNVSSVNAYRAGAGPPYAAAKAGVLNLTRDLALELADDEVTVNAVLPGVIGTPMQDQNDAETRQRQADWTPLPRVGTPGDVAGAISFFVSPDADWITGAELLVDGGYMLGGY